MLSVVIRSNGFVIGYNSDSHVVLPLSTLIASVSPLSPTMILPCTEWFPISRISLTVLNAGTDILPSPVILILTGSLDVPDTDSLLTSRYGLLNFFSSSPGTNIFHSVPPVLATFTLVLMTTPFCGIIRYIITPSGVIDSLFFVIVYVVSLTLIVASKVL